MTHDPAATYFTVLPFVPDRVHTPAAEVASNEKTTGLPEAPPVAARVAVPPTVPGAGAVKVIVWAIPVTVNVAGELVAVPTGLVKTASYSLPLWEIVVAGRARVPEVAPPIGVQVAPLSVEDCHCTVGAGFPEAAAVKDAV
jgi:hypothetical protein